MHRSDRKKKLVDIGKWERVGNWRLFVDSANGGVKWRSERFNLLDANCFIIGMLAERDVYVRKGPPRLVCMFRGLRGYPRWWRKNNNFRRLTILRITYIPIIPRKKIP